MTAIRRISLGLTALTVVALLAGCSRREPPPAADSVRSDSVRTAAPVPPAAAPRPQAITEDVDDGRAELLRRKGEILREQKRVRASTEMTPSQKDSALQALERESIELSKRLLGAGH